MFTLLLDSLETICKAIIGLKCLNVDLASSIVVICKVIQSTDKFIERFFLLENKMEKPLKCYPTFQKIGSDDALKHKFCEM